MFKVNLRQYLVLSLVLLFSACSHNHKKATIYYKDSIVRTKYQANLPKRNIQIQGTGEVITVKSGEGFYAIARKYNVSSYDLANLNNLLEPYELKIGQELYLPKYKVHKVDVGETLLSIARLYNINSKELAEINGFDTAYKVKLFEAIRIPNRVKIKDQLKKIVESTEPELDNINIPKKQSQNIAPAAKKIAFKWPLVGKIINMYGFKDGGVKHNGINIAAPLGKEIYASAEGEVTYINKDGLAGFGNIVIIEHSKTWFSTYAHLGEIIVSIGDTVKIGELIARVGDTGKVTRPQLYFELRRNNKPVDPLNHLPKNRKSG